MSQIKHTANPPEAIAPYLAPGGLVFRHYVDDRCIIQRRIPETEVGLAGRYAAEDGERTLNEFPGKEVESYVYDGDSGQLMQVAFWERVRDEC